MLQSSPMSGGTRPLGKGETRSLCNVFCHVCRVRQRNVVCYEAYAAKLDNCFGFIDLFRPGVLLDEQKSAGHGL